MAENIKEEQTKNYKVKGTRIRMGGKIYNEGNSIALTAAQAERYKRFLA